MARKASVEETPREARDIGMGIPVPKETCSDAKCPFHGNLPVRGTLIEGVVVSRKMKNTVVVERERLFYVKKYERYEKRKGRYPAHCPPCLGVEVGDRVVIGECRPLSKTVSFVVVQRKEEGE
ncbi:MAG: 30S ribosomal protein S17 [Thermoplasmata archaeon]|nr:30S ribosomal protein S17 [Thermoplasmata archaeon]